MRSNTCYKSLLTGDLSRCFLNNDVDRSEGGWRCRNTSIHKFSRSVFPNREMMCVDIVVMQSQQFSDCIKTTEKKFIQEMFVKASHRSRSSPEPLDLHGGLLRSHQPLWPRDCGTPDCIVSTLPIYGAFLIQFHTHSSLSRSLSWVVSQRAPALLDEGQKHNCYEKPPTS